MSGFVQRLDAAFYSEAERNWDDALFRQHVLEVLSGDSSVLDLGAGAGIVEQMNFKGLAGRVCGVDLDERVVANQMLDEGKVADGSKIPYPDNAFNIVFSDNVLEHLPDPEAVFKEVFRVLKPGGHFLFKTPNKWHYMPVIARLTPHRFHQWINRKRGRAEVDTFPTLYLANTRRRVCWLAAESGFEVVKIDLIEGRPEYLRIHWLPYLVGMMYERLVNSIQFLAVFRILLIGRLRKPK